MHLLHHCDDRAVPAMTRRVIAAELRCIKPRSLASIEEKRIVAAESVAEKVRKLVEAHPVVGDNKMDVGGACDADTISWLTITRIDDKDRIDRAVDHEHRSGLCGEIRLWPAG